jgi:hypothetical protein
MSKLTYTGEDVIKEIKRRSGLDVEYKVSDYFDSIEYYVPSTGVTSKITVSDWMCFQNSHSVDSVATEEFMNMNLLYVYFVMHTIGLGGYW